VLQAEDLKRGQARLDGRMAIVQRRPIRTGLPDVSGTQVDRQTADLETLPLCPGARAWDDRCEIPTALTEDDVQRAVVDRWRYQGDDRSGALVGARHQIAGVLEDSQDLEWGRRFSL
jgi:hypothetical protein